MTRHELALTHWNGLQAERRTDALGTCGGGVRLAADSAVGALLTTIHVAGHDRGRRLDSCSANVRYNRGTASQPAWPARSVRAGKQDRLAQCAKQSTGGSTTLHGGTRPKRTSMRKQVLQQRRERVSNRHRGRVRTCTTRLYRERRQPPNCNKLDVAVSFNAVSYTHLTLPTKA